MCRGSLWRQQLHTDEALPGGSAMWTNEGETSWGGEAASYTAGGGLCGAVHCAWSVLSTFLSLIYCY